MADITYYRNTSFPITVNYAAQSVVHGVKALFTAKQVQEDSVANDSTAIVQKDITLNAGAYNSSNWATAITNGIADSGSTVINPVDISDSIPPGKYWYDILVVDSSGAIYPFQKGKFILVAGPTNRDT